jgi:hypothetical protein
MLTKEPQTYICANFSVTIYLPYYFHFIYLYLLGLKERFIE